LTKKEGTFVENILHVTVLVRKEMGLVVLKPTTIFYFFSFIYLYIYLFVLVLYGGFELVSLSIA